MKQLHFFSSKVYLQDHHLLEFCHFHVSFQFFENENNLLVITVDKLQSLMLITLKV